MESEHAFFDDLDLAQYVTAGEGSEDAPEGRLVDTLQGELEPTNADTYSVDPLSAIAEGIEELNNMERSLKVKPISNQGHARNT